MGAIVLDANKVNSFVIPSLTKSENAIQDAYSTSVNLRNKLPSSFKYRSKVNDIVNQIYNIKREINDIDTIILKKIDRAKSIENKSENKASSIASKIGSIVGSISGSAVGATVGSRLGYVGTAVGAVIGAQVGQEIGKAMANTGAKVVNKFTSICGKIWSGIKNFGTKLVNKAKSFIKEKALPFLKNVGSTVWSWAKTAVKTISKTLASIANFTISIMEGIVSLAEAVVDLALIIVGAHCTKVTLLVDVITGITTGEWNFTATKAVWKKWILPWVGFDATTKLFDLAYENKIVGTLMFGIVGMFLKNIDDAAYGPFKRGGMACKIGKGVGYVTGIIVISTLTAGGGGAAITAANTASAAGTSVIGAVTSSISTTMATNTALQVSTIVAGGAKMAQSVQSGYNSLSETEKQSDTEIAKVLGSSAIKGTVEAATWYVTYGGGAQALAGSSSKVVAKTGLKKLGNTLVSKTSIKTSAKIASKTKLNEIVLPAAKSVFTKGGIQAGKEYINAGADAIVTGKYDFVDASKKALISGGTSVVYDYTFGAALSNAQTSVKNTTEAAREAVKAMPDIGDDIAPTTSSGLENLFTTTQSAGGKKIVGKAIKDSMSDPIEEVWVA